MLKLLLLSLFFVSCGNDDDTTTETTTTNTEALISKGIPYGSEPRQFLDLYRPESECPTPIYFDAHSNGGNTDLPSAIIDDLNAQGIAVISWESLTSVNTQEEVETGWNDAELMFQWVIDNADTYHLDASNIIIGGSSRGSILSWTYGHRPNASIKGLYMYNALPGNAWNFPDWWFPPNDVTASSPPIQFVYNREPGSSTDPENPDIHDPNNGFTILATYETLGIGEKAALVHSIGTTNNTDRYQFLVDFILSVMETPCP